MLHCVAYRGRRRGGARIVATLPCQDQSVTVLKTNNPSHLCTRDLAYEGKMCFEAIASRQLQANPDLKNKQLETLKKTSNPLVPLRAASCKQMALCKWDKATSKR